MSDVSFGSSLIGESFSKSLRVDETPKEQLNKVAKNIMSNEYAMAIGASVVVALILLILKPPLVQEKSSSTLYEGKLSTRKFLTWTILAGVFTLIGPKIVALINKKKQ